MASEIAKLRGIGDTVRRKLEQAGYVTVEALALATPLEVAAAAGISEQKAAEIIAEAKKAIKLEMKTALQLKREAGLRKKVTTGSRNLDGILGGGVETRTITEFFGEYGSGKTQICHQLAVNAQLPEDKGGLGGKAVYIDTEGTFRWERIEQMAKALGLDPEEAMDNIFWVRAVNSYDQMNAVRELHKVIKRENVKLVVVDSVTSHFRADYPGRENLARRQQMLNVHLHDLMKLAEAYNIAVVVTNQVMTRPDMFYGDPTQAVGGHVLGHAPGVRVYLKKRRGNVRLARVIDAPHLPEAEAEFAITPEGIRDPE